MLNYFLLIAVTALAIFGFYKDRDAYKTKWRRRAVLLLTVLIGIGGIVNYYYGERRAEKQHADDQTKIAELKSAVDTANKNQQDNTIQFVDAFGKLSQKLSDLQTQIKTAGLQKEAAKLKEQLAVATKASVSTEATVTRLKSDLEATRKALSPAQTSLTFTFAKSDPGAPPIHEVTLPVKDNKVHVEFSVRNETDTTALDGELTIFIPNDCKFASEPPEFKKLPGHRDFERIYSFARLLPKTELKTLSADIEVPQNIKAMEFGINYRCTNCDFPEKPLIGIVKLAR